MPDSLPVSINAVFCDDIRREDNGKVLLIGVYTDGLMPSAFPTGFPLSAWLRVGGLPPGSGQVSFRLLVNDVQHVQGVAPFEIADTTKPLNMFIPGIPINIDRPGSIVIELNMADGTILGSAKLDVFALQPQSITPPAASSPSTPG